LLARIDLEQIKQTSVKLHLLKPENAVCTYHRHTRP
jgi:hypothetical protein